VDLSNIIPSPSKNRRLQTDTRAHKEEDKDQKQQKNARRKATPKINEREYHAR
jgi:hypothetical protein